MSPDYDDDNFLRKRYKTGDSNFSRKFAISVEDKWDPEVGFIRGSTEPIKLLPHSKELAEQELQVAALKSDWQHVDEMLDLMIGEK